jgi:hypothetical protein
MIRVIKPFFDLQDDCHEYKVGDEFPRKGRTVTDARIAELAGTKNKIGAALVEAETPKQDPKPKKQTKKIDE